MRVLSLLAGLGLSVLTVASHAASISSDITAKIVSQGVSANAVERLSNFLAENEGRTFSQDAYYCEGKEISNIKPCEEEKRRRTTRNVTLKSPEYAAIVDFSKPSTEKRFYLVNLKTGNVEKFLGAHGVGSGNANFASRFSNTKDSRQTSLGIYMAGEVYQGAYGQALRMYGLQPSNDQGYNRDIVLHGAWYVSEDFPGKLNPKTKEPYGRIGLSWGCPAVSLSYIQKLVKLLKDGGIIMHYHASLMDEAQNGREVIDPEHVFDKINIPIPTARPEYPTPVAP